MNKIILGLIAVFHCPTESVQFLHGAALRHPLTYTYVAMILMIFDFSSNVHMEQGSRVYYLMVKITLDNVGCT